MTRKPLIVSIIVAYTGLAVVTSGWALKAWNSSSPGLIEVVKGASSDSLDTPATTQPYAWLTVPRGTRIQAAHVAIYQVDTGQFLYEQDADSPVAIASITKLMTAYITTTQGNLDDVVTVSKNGSNQQPSIMNLQYNEKMTVRNLLYGMLLVSGNDAAYTLGEYMGGKLLNKPDATGEEKVARFVEEMNIQAGKLFMTETHFEDPAGLGNGLSTARDVAKLASVATEQTTIKKIIGTADTTVTDQKSLYQHPLHNSNRLLADMPYAGINGGKTGLTDEAGHCLVVSATRDGHTMVAVILHTDYYTNDASALAARDALDLAFTQTQYR